MKKLFVLLAAVVLVTNIAFAQDSNNYYFDEVSSDETTSDRTNSGRTTKKFERFNAELGPGFTFHWTNGNHNDFEDKTVTANTSIGIGFTVNFTNTIGLTLDADFSYGAKLFGVARPETDYLSLTGVNLFLGSVFYLFNNNIFKIPFGVGAHIYYFSDDLWVPGIDEITGAWVNRSDMQLGLGLSLGLQFHFNNGVYLFSRTNAALDFVRLHTRNSRTGSTPIEEEPETGDTSPIVKDDHVDVFPVSWNVKPSFGIGVRF